MPARPEGLDTAILVFPLFLVYQIGIVAGGAGRNGVDLVTSLLIGLCEYNLGAYLLLILFLLIAYWGVVLLLRRSGRFHPRRFGTLLVESTIYAVCMGGVILIVLRYVFWFMPGVSAGADPGAERGLVEILVISAGAGLHEEFIFRAGLMGGLGFFLQQTMRSPKLAWLIALVVSSVVFSWVHHLGPVGEDFTSVAFLYRTLAGMYFGVVYQFRGFAIAAWTHAIYDFVVLSFG
jgi:membrane protease YdiL (CAAX protease family)